MWNCDVCDNSLKLMVLFTYVVYGPSKISDIITMIIPLDTETLFLLLAETGFWP